MQPLCSPRADIFQYLTANGQKGGQYQNVRRNTNYNSPVTSLSSNDLRCNVGASSNGGNTTTVAVAAGSSVTFTADTAVYHQGPVSFYMSKVADAVASDGSGDWFKVRYENSCQGNVLTFARSRKLVPHSAAVKRNGICHVRSVPNSRAVLCLEPPEAHRLTVHSHLFRQPSLLHRPGRLPAPHRAAWYPQPGWHTTILHRLRSDQGDWRRIENPLTHDKDPRTCQGHRPRIYRKHLQQLQQLHRARA